VEAILGEDEASTSEESFDDADVDATHDVIKVGEEELLDTVACREGRIELVSEGREQVVQVLDDRDHPYTKVEGTQNRPLTNPLIRKQDMLGMFSVHVSGGRGGYELELIQQRIIFIISSGIYLNRHMS
jgi:hypothetical protein